MLLPEVTGARAWIKLYNTLLTCTAPKFRSQNTYPAESSWIWQQGRNTLSDRHEGNNNCLVLSHSVRGAPDGRVVRGSLLKKPTLGQFPSELAISVHSRLNRERDGSSIMSVKIGEEG